MRIVVCAAASYLARRGEPVEPAALADHDCVVDANFRDPDAWRFCGPDGAPIRVAVRGRLRFSSPETCLVAAAAGLGIARVPSFIAGPRLARGELVALLKPFEVAPGGVYAVYPPGRHLAGKVRALVDFLGERFRGVPSWDQGW